ncbi:hypothetical protein WMY93_015334 [Mugilogobius chulae]|uniref:Phorbol-ester/DAG-type domain-containing protein n=1 Tax=Mugilogobius chulae TaxID=88201 RepID=A0AAW0NQY5_9GOBI
MFNLDQLRSVERRLHVLTWTSSGLWSGVYMFNPDQLRSVEGVYMTDQLRSVRHVLTGPAQAVERVYMTLTWTSSGLNLDFQDSIFEYFNTSPLAPDLTFKIFTVLLCFFSAVGLDSSPKEATPPSPVASPEQQEVMSPPAPEQPAPSIGHASSATGHAPLQPKAHQLSIKTFSSPPQCSHCSAVMTGLTRQGYGCEVCSFVCHVTCRDHAPQICPIPSELRPAGVDVQRGIGTAYKGYVRVPKPSGVKKGWQRVWAVISDCRLDEFFSVCSVMPSDVIHAPRKDVPCIFKVQVGSRESSLVPVSVLVLADSEQEQRKWLKVLESLHVLLRQNGLLQKPVQRPLEVYDPSLPMIKSTLSAALLVIVRASDTKKIHQVELVPHENCWSWSVPDQTSPSSVLDGPGRIRVSFDVKLTETKGCQDADHPELCDPEEPRAW